MNKQNQTTERAESRSTGESLLAGLVLGGLVGAGAMLLLAPQSGKRTRDEIRGGAVDLRDRTRQRVATTLSQVRSRAENVALDIRDTADQLEDQGKGIAIEQLDRLAVAAQDTAGLAMRSCPPGRRDANIGAHHRTHPHPSPCGDRTHILQGPPTLVT